MHTTSSYYSTLLLRTRTHMDSTLQRVCILLQSSMRTRVASRSICTTTPSSLVCLLEEYSGTQHVLQEYTNYVYGTYSSQYIFARLVRILLRARTVVFFEPLHVGLFWPPFLMYGSYIVRLIHCMHTTTRILYYYYYERLILESNIIYTTSSYSRVYQLFYSTSQWQ